MSELFDLRESMYREALALGHTYEQYVQFGSETEQRKFQTFADRITFPEALLNRARLWKRTLHCLVFSGMWCGDCARQCPMLACIAGASGFIKLRFLDNQEHARFANEVRIHGASRVPTAVFLSEDFYELGRFGDRTYSHYKRKLEKESGATCDAGLGLTPQEELQEELQEWFEIFDRFQCLLTLSPMLRKRYGD